MLGRDSRRLRVGHPGRAGMTPDEIQVLSPLAAAMVLADRLAGAGIDISARLHIGRAVPVGHATGLRVVQQAH